MGLLSDLGIATATITYGKDSSFAGAPAATTIKVTPRGLGGVPLALVWDASGDVFQSFTDTSSAAPNVVGQIVLPQTGQTGFISDGLSFKDWYYEAVVTSTVDGQPGRERIYRFQIPTGVTAIDIDRLPREGSVVSAPVLAPLPIVSSVQGQTGAVDLSTIFITPAALPDLIQGKADVATTYTRIASDARFAPIDINASGIIRHGTDPNVARGAASGYRIWVGSVYPVNRIPGDVWVVATQKAVEPPISWFAQYRADIIGSADLATLTSWADSSGNARNLTQATAGKRPVFHVASGGVPAYLTFDGSKNMQTAAFGSLLAQPYTLMMTVCMLSVSTSAAVTKRIIDGLDATNFLNFQQRGDGTNAKWQASAGTTVSGPGSAVAAQWAVVTLVVNGSGSKIRINGVEGTGNVGAAALGGLTVGSKFDSTVFADFDTTDIRLSTGLLSASQIASVEAALADSVGIILSA